MAEITIDAYSIDGISNLFGNFDFNIRLIEREYDVKITNRDTLIKIEGEGAETAKALILELLELSKKGEIIDEQKIRMMFDMEKGDGYGHAFEIFSCAVLHNLDYDTVYESVEYILRKNGIDYNRIKDENIIQKSKLAYRNWW